jgi:hypothetical protein
VDLRVEECVIMYGVWTGVFIHIDAGGTINATKLYLLKGEHTQRDLPKRYRKGRSEEQREHGRGEDSATARESRSAMFLATAVSIR